MSTRNHWEILKEIDPALEEKISSWRLHLLSDDEKLARKYRELINFTMACMNRDAFAAKAHGELAYKFGATKNEIIGTIEQIMTMGGFPSIRIGLQAMDEILTDEE